MSIDKKDNYIDLHKIITQILDNWKLFLTCMITCLSASLFFIWYSTPLYKVHAEVLIQDDKNDNNSISLAGNSQIQQFGNLFGGQTNINNELGILQTRDITERVVRDLNLNVTVYDENGVKSNELYNAPPFNVRFIPVNDSTPSSSVNVIFDEGYNTFNIKSGDIDLNGAKVKFGDTIISSIGILIFSKTGLLFSGQAYSVLLTSVDAQVANLSRHLATNINDESTIISLTLNTNIPQKGEDVLQSLINTYIQRNLTEKNKISDSILTFIRSRVNIVSEELNNIEARIQGFKQKNKLANIDEQSKALVGNASDYYNKLNETDLQLNVINTMLSGIKQNSKSPVPTLTIGDVSFVSLVQKYNTLITQRDRLLLSTTQINPFVKNINNQIEAVRADMIANLENQRQALQITRNNIIAQNGQINDMVSTVPVQERQYVNLSRERDVKQELYLFLVQQEEATAITKASNIPSESVIAVPKSEYDPYFPSKPITLGIGLTFALALPLSFLYIKQLLNKKIQSREDITNNTNCPVLAEIGHSETVKGILRTEHSRTVLAEQFRIFRTNLNFVVKHNKCCKILITSTMSGEGKSFISINLAQVCAYSGKKVLLMEMDLRKPKLSSMMNISNDKGFSNYMLANDQDITKYIKVTEQNNNVFILNSGPIPPNPAELLMSEKVSKMFDILESKFDIIIIDSPPVSAVTDAQILSRYSDVSLYIVRQLYSYKNCINIINDLIKSNKLPNLYLVINDIKKNASDRYGYGYAYGYEYGYASEEKKPVNGKALHFFKQSE